MVADTSASKAKTDVARHPSPNPLLTDAVEKGADCSASAQVERPLEALPSFAVLIGGGDLKTDATNTNLHATHALCVSGGGRSSAAPWS